VKFLHVIDRYFPAISGSEIYMQEIGERLALEGHAVSVYTTEAAELEYFWSNHQRPITARAEEHNGVQIQRFPVERLPLARLTYPTLRRGMAALARLPVNTTPLLFQLSRWTPRVPALERGLESLDARFNLVHAVNISLDSIIFAASRFARRQHLPLVLTPFIHLGEPGDRRISQYYTMPHQIELLRRADAVIVQTTLELEALVRYQVPRERLHLIGVGVDPHGTLGGDSARFRAKYNIAGPIVFFVGAAAYDKGAMQLVAAMERLWTRHDATLVLAGPVPTAFRRYLAARSRETRRRTRVLGFIPEADKRDLFAAGDVFVMPSRTDSFGIVYLEAWLYNKPVIGARAGGVPAVIREGRDGLLVTFGNVDELADRIEQLLSDRALARLLGAAGHDKVLNEYTWDKKYAQVRALYHEVVERK
jgi:glycogen(starch) synthase